MSLFLPRLLSTLGVASRAEAVRLIRAGRVRVNGHVVTDARVRVLRTARVSVDDGDVVRRGDHARRVIALNKPRGTVTTRRDPEGRPTVFDVLGDAGRDLVSVGRLDRASTGLLLFTTDTALAAALTDPARAIVRRYVVTVRGRVTPEATARLEAGLDLSGERGRVERLHATRVVIRKASGRETHLLVDLDEGRNREIRRLFQAIGHEATRVHRVAFGAITLGSIPPGAWRSVEAEAITATLGHASATTARPPATTSTPRPPRARTGASGSAASCASTRGR
ncbi:MAG TPA: pseudouridine synthase [Vicinamibacterales bacterium]